ncbi:hypothetical protein C6401_07935, partial [Arthrobacter woluwensis]
MKIGAPSSRAAFTGFFGEGLALGVGCAAPVGADDGDPLGVLLPGVPVPESPGTGMTGTPPDPFPGVPGVPAPGAGVVA